MNLSTSQVAAIEVTVSPALAGYPPGSCYGPRTLTDFELVWLVAGSARWRSVGGDRGSPGSAPGDVLGLGPGDMLLIPPGTRDEFRWDREVPTQHGYVHFGADPGPAAEPLLRRGQLHGPAGGLLEFLLWLGEVQGPGWRERAGELVALIASVLTAGPLPEPPKPEPAALAAALGYVCRQWASAMRPLPLHQLAAAAHVSPSYLSRVFRARYGCGPGTALELVRLSRARTMLTRSNLTVVAVARACGFADPLYFSRRFRAAYGIAPTVYRDNPAAAVPSDPPGLRALARRLPPGL
ncbi:MAG TPA: helix-turn-helix transcriptional regulator [Trebonia sp.]|nr:helix-turn-helix transcriptional regulator [Trebonia sp.]